MDDVKNEILRQGFEVFSETGFKKAGIRRIVERCGISIGSFYAHFTSKEELFIHIYLQEHKRVMAELAREIPRLEEKGYPPWRIIKHLITQLLKRFDQNPVLREYFDRPQFEKIFAKLPPALDGEYQQAVVSIWESDFERWKAQEEIKEISISFLFSLINSIALVVSQRRYVGGDTDDFENVQQFLVEAVSKHLRE